jgi:hypothetical protein
MLVALVLLVVTAVMPYVGLKTRAALTMYSNLRTEPGHWNHLLVPEEVRLFDWQDGEIHFLETDDADLAREIDDLVKEGTVLLDARRIVADHQDATVRYVLDGETRTASPVSDDPVLGKSLPLAIQLLGAFRPFDSSGTCQH